MNVHSSEEIAAEELNVSGYAGKWKAAKETCADISRCGSHYRGLPYWERVRLMFLELGGERIDGRRC